MRFGSLIHMHASTRACTASNVREAVGEALEIARWFFFHVRHRCAIPPTTYSIRTDNMYHCSDHQDLEMFGRMAHGDPMCPEVRREYRE